MIPGVCSVPFSLFPFPSLTGLVKSGTPRYTCSEFLHVYLLQNMFSSGECRSGWSSNAEIHLHHSDKETAFNTARYQMKLPHEINGVQAGVSWKLLVSRPVCIRQTTTHCLDLHCFDDPIEVVLVSVSTGVNNPISRNGRLLSD